MIEKIIVLEDVDPVIFYGVNNSNIQIIKALYPKLRIVARGNVLKVLGDEEEMCSFEENIVAIEKYCATYNQLTEDNVVDIIKGRRPGAEYGDSVILFNINGKPEIFYKSYTSQGLRTLGMKRIGAEPSPMIPLFHSLAEITEDGKSDDYFLYTGGSSGGGQFAVRYGDDTLIAQYADNVKSGSRTIISVAGERRIGRLRLHKDGVSIEGKFYSYQECETLPLYIIARIQKVLKGRN